MASAKRPKKEKPISHLELMGGTVRGDVLSPPEYAPTLAPSLSTVSDERLLEYLHINLQNTEGRKRAYRTALASYTRPTAKERGILAKLQDRVWISEEKVADIEEEICRRRKK